MKRIISIFIFLSFFTLISSGQNPHFNIKNRVSINSTSAQVHSLWRGVKNPFIITSSDTTLDYSISANGGIITNQLKNHEFDFIPFQKNVTLYLISSKNDTLHQIKLISRKLYPPNFELSLESNQLNDNDQVSKKEIAKLELKAICDSQLTKDLIELPKYDLGKIEIIHTRDDKSISVFSSMSSLKSIKSTVKKSDKIIIIISSYSYKDAMNEIVENKISEIYKLKVK